MAAKDDKKKNETAVQKGFDPCYGWGIAIIVIAFIAAGFYEPRIPKAKRTASAVSVGKQSTKTQPPAPPEPETITVTTDSWSKHIRTQNRITGITFTTGADVKVRVTQPGGSVKEFPISSVGKIETDSLQFKLVRPFKKVATVTVYQFRNQAEYDRWLKEP